MKRAAVIDALAALDQAHSVLGNRGSSAQEAVSAVSASLKALAAMSKSKEANIPI